MDTRLMCNLPALALVVTTSMLAAPLGARSRTAFR